ncbi:MAG: hypothetical protein Q4D16_19755 [Eubacteriales bacterium]|nr:hypothetical protein [Eubacteriales bacterium]
MALITCPECGKEFSDQASACPNCACPTQPIASKGGITCPKCKGRNVQVSLEAVEEKSKGRDEVRKKSIVTRAANSAGRATMVMATAGLWALTPKKSKYSEKKTGKTKIINKKYAICQDCGNSWEVK